jgi:ATP-binding cassette, subfamily B, bacterial
MRERMRGLRVLFALAWRTDKRGLLSSLLLWNVGGLTYPLGALWLKYATNGLLAHDSVEVLLALSALALSWIVALSAQNIGINRLNTVREQTTIEVEAHLLQLVAAPPGLEHHERADVSDHVALLRDDRDKLSYFLYSFLFFQGLLPQMLLTLVLLGRLHPLLLLLPLFALPQLYAAAWAQQRLGRTREQVADKLKLADHLLTLATEPASSKELRVFGVRGQFRARERDLWHQITQAELATWLRTSTGTIASWIVFGLGYAGAIALVAKQAFDGQATPGDVILAVALAGQINGQLASASWSISTLFEATRTMRNYLWLIDYAKDAERRTTGDLPRPRRLERGIHLEDVSFSYPGTETPVLDAIDLEVAAGTTLAIVGENGAGKTTLVKLLCRYYEPTRGRITVDGVDLSTLSVPFWRDGISGSFQDFARLELLIRETVGVGDLPRLDDRPAVRSALDRADATSLVGRFENGLETKLGRSFGDGVELSGGQWQKLALGRAMMRELPLLLILDEPTAALDPHAEHVLFTRYAQTARTAAGAVGAITILVSHRFSTVRMADQIVVLEAGRIRERGTHQLLLRHHDLYAELYGLQAKAYH